MFLYLGGSHAAVNNIELTCNDKGAKEDVFFEYYSEIAKQVDMTPKEYIEALRQITDYNITCNQSYDSNDKNLFIIDFLM